MQSPQSQQDYQSCDPVTLSHPISHVPYDHCISSNAGTRLKIQGSSEVRGTLTYRDLGLLDSNGKELCQLLGPCRLCCLLIRLHMRPCMLQEPSHAL